MTQQENKGNDSAGNQVESSTSSMSTVSSATTANKDDVQILLKNDSDLDISEPITDTSVKNEATSQWMEENQTSLEKSLIDKEDNNNLRSSHSSEVETEDQDTSTETSLNQQVPSIVQRIESATAILDENNGAPPVENDDEVTNMRTMATTDISMSSQLDTIVQKETTLEGDVSTVEEELIDERPVDVHGAMGQIIKESVMRPIRSFLSQPRSEPLISHPNDEMPKGDVVAEARRQPKSAEEEAQLAAKYAQIEDLGDRVFAILKDLGMVG